MHQEDISPDRSRGVWYRQCQTNNHCSEACRAHSAEQPVQQGSTQNLSVDRSRFQTCLEICLGLFSPPKTHFQQPTMKLKYIDVPQLPASPMQLGKLCGTGWTFEANFFVWSAKALGSFRTTQHLNRSSWDWWKSWQSPCQEACNSILDACGNYWRFLDQPWLPKGVSAVGL